MCCAYSANEEVTTWTKEGMRLRIQTTSSAVFIAFWISSKYSVFFASGSVTDRGGSNLTDRYNEQRAAYDM